MNRFLILIMLGAALVGFGQNTPDSEIKKIQDHRGRWVHYKVIQSDTAYLKTLNRLIVRKLGLKQSAPVFQMTIADRVSNEKENNSPPPFFMLHMDPKLKGKPKFILFKNTMLRYFQTRIEPILNTRLEPGRSETRALKSDLFFKKMLLHHLAHLYGPATTIDDSGKPVFIDKKIGSNYTILEEIRADLFSVKIAEKLVDEEIFTKQDLAELHRIHIAHLIADHSVPFRNIQYNYLLKKGCLVKNIVSGKQSIEHEEFNAKISALSKYIRQLLKKADRQLISSFIKPLHKGRSVKDQLKLLTPNGKESWQIGSRQTIRWHSDIIPIQFTLALLRNGKRIAIITNNISSDQTSFIWTVGKLKKGSMTAGNRYAIRIVAQIAEKKWIWDDSDAEFSVPRRR